MPRDQRELNWRQFQQHDFVLPSPELAQYVARYWIVKWAYEQPYRQLIVPYPGVQLTFRDGSAEIHGVSSGRVVKELRGGGRIFGVEFRPGCFRPFLGAPVLSITDRTIPAAEVFRDLPPTAEIDTVEKMLRSNQPPSDPRSELATEIVGRVIVESAIRRVDQLSAEVGTSVRQLQRLFAEHVGVSPKWVIRRYRLDEVTERMAAGEAVDWPALAADLGYADQAHFVRDFTKMYGETPTRYAARY